MFWYRWNIQWLPYVNSCMLFFATLAHDWCVLKDFLLLQTTLPSSELCSEVMFYLWCHNYYHGNQHSVLLTQYTRFTRELKSIIAVKRGEKPVFSHKHFSLKVRNPSIYFLQIFFFSWLAFSNIPKDEMRNQYTTCNQHTDGTSYISEQHLILWSGQYSLCQWAIVETATTRQGLKQILQSNSVT